MEALQTEAGIILALQALEKNPKLSYRKAASIYNVSRTTLQARRDGRTSRRDCTANLKKLTNSEERAIVKYILQLDSQGLPPRYLHVEDMANKLLSERSTRRVGVRWAKNFVQRQPELTTRFKRKYDYQRAKCEDPTIIRGWFTLLENTIAKYGIVESDIYNFDETGFLMGFITTGMVITSSDRIGKAKAIQPGNREWVTVIQAVNSLGSIVPPYIVVKGQNHLAPWYEDERLPADWRVNTSSNGWTTNEIGIDWIQHFHKCTKDQNTGAYRLLILDGHKSHHSATFELFCQNNNIITLCMPAHSSHILQPLDVGCFGPLKKAYGRQIEDLIKASITHITKEDFLPAFYAAFYDSITKANIQGGFRGAGIVPFDPEKVISTLELKFTTPSPSNSRPGSAGSWVSRTPSTATEVVSQSSILKKRITDHPGSSPTKSLDVLECFEKGATAVMHEVALLRAQVRGLQAANELVSKRRRAKKTRLQAEGSLSVQDARDLKEQMDIDVQVHDEIKVQGGRKARVETRSRRCGICGQPGHNARTCVIDVEASEEESDN